MQPDLVVDVKPTLRQRKIAEREKQRVQMQEEFWNRRRMAEAEMDDEERVYWEERRRFDDEYNWRNFAGRGRPAPLMGGPFFNNMMNPRRIESADDRHVIARHAEIYPKEEELQIIQRIVSHTERALKLVSDAMTDPKATSEAVPAATVATKEEAEEETTEKDTEITDEKTGEVKATTEKDNSNQMISFQKEAENNVRMLKGVMRVGLLAKGEFLNHKKKSFVCKKLLNTHVFLEFYTHVPNNFSVGNMIFHFSRDISFYQKLNTQNFTALISLE